MMKKDLNAIFMSATNNILREIAAEKMSYTTWKKLDKLYSGKSPTSLLYLKKRLYNLQMVEGMPIKNHRDKFYSIIMD